MLNIAKIIFKVISKRETLNFLASTIILNLYLAYLGIRFKQGRYWTLMILIWWFALAVAVFLEV